MIQYVDAADIGTDDPVFFHKGGTPPERKKKGCMVEGQLVEHRDFIIQIGRVEKIGSLYTSPVHPVQVCGDLTGSNVYIYGIAPGQLKIEDRR